MMKYFVLSDVHSKFDLMVDALEEKGFDKEDPNHKIIFLGDAFDKGDKPVETYLYFKDLVEKDKMIWTLGNHDVELINVIRNRKYSRDCRNTPISIAKYYNSSIDEDSDIEEVCSTLENNGVLDLLLNKTCDYFELDKYIFVHGCIPTLKGEYDPKWREVPRSKWDSLLVRSGNGVKFILKKGLRIPGKTLVCGHVGSYFGHLVHDHPELELDSKEFNRLKNKYSKDVSKYHMFIDDKVINLDGNGYRTGIINVLVIEGGKDGE